MPAEFDPYHRWLGISPKHRPPDHYRLLGVEQFESDPEVIRDAAAQRMAHVRTYQLGQHSELSQKILNELGAAKACLLDPAEKARYDANLKGRSAAVTVKPAPPPASPAAPDGAPADSAAPENPPPLPRRTPLAGPGPASNEGGWQALLAANATVKPAPPPAPPAAPEEPPSSPLSIPSAGAGSAPNEGGWRAFLAANAKLGLICAALVVLLSLLFLVIFAVIAGRNKAVVATGPAAVAESSGKRKSDQEHEPLAPTTAISSKPQGPAPADAKPVIQSLTVTPQQVAAGEQVTVIITARSEAAMRISDGWFSPVGSDAGRIRFSSAMSRRLEPGMWRLEMVWRIKETQSPGRYALQLRLENAAGQRADPWGGDASLTISSDAPNSLTAKLPIPGKPAKIHKVVKVVRPTPLRGIVSLSAPYPKDYPGAEADKMPVEYAVKTLVEQAGLHYDFKTSFKNTDPICRHWIRPDIQNQPCNLALKSILGPLGLSYDVLDGNVVLKRR
jgi:hypothetical protein